MLQKIEFRVVITKDENYNAFVDVKKITGVGKYTELSLQDKTGSSLPLIIENIINIAFKDE